MKHDFRLAGPPSGRRLEFSWDAKSGEIDGRDAAEVLDLVAWATDRGHVHVDQPAPSNLKRVAITNPTKNLKQFSAVIFSAGWELSTPLMYPTYKPTTVEILDEDGNVIERFPAVN